MSFIKSTGEGLKGVSLTDPRELLTDLLRTSSGVTMERTVRFNIFYQIVAFKGVKDGIGTSTIVANTALALAKLGLNVCVVDTSILSPCQDVLLKTNYHDNIDKKQGVVDWFDMGFTKQSVLNISYKDRKISVLSFQNRTIIDLLSTSDNESLVELAFSQLTTKYDIVLVDVCSEPSNIATTCLQLAHKVIQVWNNSISVMRNVENAVANNIICSCSMDKMRYVVTSMVIEELATDWDALFKKFHFKHLANVGMSMEIAKRLTAGQVLYDLAVSHPDIQQFNDCITDIVCHLLDINPETGKVNAEYTSAQVEDETVEEVSDVPLEEEFPEAGEHNLEETYMSEYEENADDVDLFDTEMDEEVPPEVVKPSEEGVEKKPKAKRGFFGFGGRK